MFGQGYSTQLCVCVCVCVCVCGEGGCLYYMQSALTHEQLTESLSQVEGGQIEGVREFPS